MKLHALRQPARAEQGKDLPDVVGLVKTLDIDVQAEDFQAIVAKYADERTRYELFRNLGFAE